jgi:hypothetical protein
MSRYLTITNYDSPVQHMTCSRCKRPALMEYWEWSEIAEDKLQCPHCCAVVKIGKWIDGIPAAKPKQKCVICNGTGNADTSLRRLSKRKIQKLAADYANGKVMDER